MTFSVPSTPLACAASRYTRDGADDAGGIYCPVHVKTPRRRKLRMLLTHCKLLQSEAIAITDDLRGLAQLWPQGGYGRTGKFEADIPTAPPSLSAIGVTDGVIGRQFVDS